jgi:hypothetical protein
MLSWYLKGSSAVGRGDPFRAGYKRTGFDTVAIGEFRSLFAITSDSIERHPFEMLDLSGADKRRVIGLSIILVAINGHGAFHAIRRRCCEKRWCDADFPLLIGIPNLDYFASNHRDIANTSRVTDTQANQSPRNR